MIGVVPIVYDTHIKGDTRICADYDMSELPKIMREIKFRFWDGKKMIYHGYEYGECSFHGLLVCEGDTIPSEYTGLKDKNGKEIYEGDICKKDSTFPIEIIWHKSGWHTRYKAEGELEIDVFLNDMEVIGNIYENPELIKV